MDVHDVRRAEPTLEVLVAAGAWIAKLARSLRTPGAARAGEYEALQLGPRGWLPLGVSRVVVRAGEETELTIELPAGAK